MGGIGLGWVMCLVVVVGLFVMVLSVWLSFWVVFCVNVEMCGLYWDVLIGVGFL